MLPPFHGSVYLKVVTLLNDSQMVRETNGFSSRRLVCRPCCPSQIPAAIEVASKLEGVLRNWSSLLAFELNKPSQGPQRRDNEPVLVPKLEQTVILAVFEVFTEESFVPATPPVP